MNRSFPADLAGLTAAAVLFVYALVTPAAVPTRVLLPATLGPLRLIQSLTGAEAGAFVNRMHGRAVTPQATAVGLYAGPAGTATLYHSVYRTGEQARRVDGGMRAKIETGKFPFGHPSQIVVGGTTITRCVGLGQIHYFSATGPHLLWIAVDSSVADLARGLLSGF